MLGRLALAACLSAAALAGTGGGSPAGAADFLVTAARPNSLFLVNLETRSVVQSCPLPGEFGPGVIQMSPDNKVAYILNHRWENVYGVEVDTCNLVFSAEQSKLPDLRVKSIGSLAVSTDGRELYTIQVPTRLHSDHYEVLEPRFAVFDTAAGLKAEPVRTFPVPRRIAIMSAAKDGKVYAGGHEMYAIDPAAGTVSIATPHRSWDRPTYSTPDVLAFWPVGTQAREFLLLYSAAVFASPEKAEMTSMVWGYSTVNLDTGATEIKDFAPFEVIMFSAVRSPMDKNLLYGVYTQLSKHDVNTQTLIKRVDLPHTYYVINISSDGRELYVGGTNHDIGIYDAETLERTGEILLPGGGDMGTATLQVFAR